MSEVIAEFAWVHFYKEVVSKMLSWPKPSRAKKLYELLNNWIGKDYENPLPSYVLAEITTPKTYPARAAKAKGLAHILGLPSWPGDFSGVPGTYSGSAFLSSPAPTEELVTADWNLMAAAFKPNVLEDSKEFVLALQKVFDGLEELGRGKDRAEVTKFVSSVNPEVFIPLDENNRAALEENSDFTKSEIEDADKSAENYMAFVKKWHEVYPDLKPIVFNHHAWEKALGKPITKE